MAQKNDKIGALWSKTSKDGKTKYMSGVIEIDGMKYKIAVFVNGKKQEEKHPDFNIVLSENPSF